jgi:hypothetical protein
MQKIRPLKKKTCPVRFARLVAGHLLGEKNGIGIGTKFYIAVTNANKKRIPRFNFYTPAIRLRSLFISHPG